MLTSGLPMEEERLPLICWLLGFSDQQNKFVNTYLHNSCYTDHLLSLAKEYNSWNVNSSFLH